MSLQDAIDSILGQSRDVAVEITDTASNKIDSMMPQDASESASENIAAQIAPEPTQATDAASGIDLPEPESIFDGLSGDTVATEFGVFALAWLVLACITQSSAWKTLSKKELPSPIALVLGVICAGVVIFGLAVFLPMIPLSVHIAAIKASIGFLILLPALVVLAVIGEKVLTMISKARS